MRFSAGEAAFEGFRVTRHHPAAVFGWSLIMLLSLIASVLTALPILQPVAAEMQAMLQSAMTGVQSEPSAAMQARMTFAVLATTPINLVTQAILLPALYRAMQSEGRDRFAFIRLGRDELRVLIVLAVLAMISLVLNHISELAVALSGQTNWSAVGGLVSFALTLLSIIVSVRLVLAVPATFVDGTIDLKSAWGLTKGVFWPLFGMAILVGVMACIVVLLLVMVALPISAVLTSSAATAAGAAAAVGLLLLMAIGAALAMTIVTAPFMTAYRDMTGQR